MGNRTTTFDEATAKAATITNAFGVKSEGLITNPDITNNRQKYSCKLSSQTIKQSVRRVVGIELTFVKP